MSKRPRPRRVAVQGARMHFANSSAELLNISRSGALIRLSYQPRVGGEWPLVLDLPMLDESIWLNGRVVRCRAAEPQSRHMPLAGREYLLALKFIDPTPEAQDVLDRVCGTPPAARQLVPPAGRKRVRKRSIVWRLRRLSVSLRRRCPECRSAEVIKDVRHRYSCKQCGREFSGLRVGPLRFGF